MEGWKLRGELVNQEWGDGNGWEAAWEVQAIFPTLSHHYQSHSPPHPTTNMLTSPTRTSPKGPASFELYVVTGEAR